MPTDPTQSNPTGQRIGPEAFGDGDETSPMHAWRQAIADIGELKDYVGYYLTARWDRIKLTLRNVGLYAALGAMGAVAGATMVIVAAVFLINGLAGLINSIWRSSHPGLDPWLGQLIVGVLVFSIAGIGAWIALNKLFGISRRKTVEKYEHKLRQQRLQHGYDVETRARS